MNIYGNLLLECCKRCGLFICNGRIFTDRSIGRNTCKDSSLVDYLIVHPSMFDFISYFKVEDSNPMFSDVHCTGTCGQDHMLLPLFYLFFF